MTASHHGSRTSSSEPFVRAVNPAVAVFSVQRDSRFGHPHPMVLERYQALGTHVLRTDEHGATTVRTDGRSIWVEPYIGAPAVLSPSVTQSLAESHAPPPGHTSLSQALDHPPPAITRRADMLSASGFQHRHFNSLDAEAAIAFYSEQFRGTAKTSEGRLPALQSPNNVLILYIRVDTAPATSPQSAIWHFGWHVPTRASASGWARAGRWSGGSSDRQLPFSHGMLAWRYGLGHRPSCTPL